MNNCHICYSHGLAKVNFNHENSESSDTSVNESDLEPNVTIKFYHWYKNEAAYLSYLSFWTSSQKLSQIWKSILSTKGDNMRQQPQKSSWDTTAY